MAGDTIAERMFDVPCRVESVIWIPGACVDGESLPDSFSEDFVEDMPENPNAKLYDGLPNLKKYADGDEYPEPEEVAYALSGTPGFLVKAATPIKRYFDENACEYSWGGYYTAWLYAADETKIGEVVVAWANERNVSDKAKLLATA